MRKAIISPVRFSGSEPVQELPPVFELNSARYEPGPSYGNFGFRHYFFDDICRGQPVTGIDKYDVIPRGGMNPLVHGVINSLVLFRDKHR